jgi:hypothetical protein
MREVSLPTDEPDLLPHEAEIRPKLAGLLPALHRVDPSRQLTRDAVGAQVTPVQLDVKAHTR